MSDELLDEALRALRRRDETAGEDDPGDEATLTRILATLEGDPLLDAGIEVLRAEDAARDAAPPSAETLARIQRSLARRDEVPAPRARGSWRTMAAAAAVIVVCLAGAPSAWAWAVEWVQRLEASDAPAAPPEPVERRVAPTRVVVPRERIPAPPPAEPLAIAEGVDPPPASNDEPPPARVTPPRPAPIEAPDPPIVRIADPVPSAPSAEDIAERSAFEQAHRLHFQSGDPLGALDAWDAYLASYPRGRFQQEARYNRAITLVRLGRAEEAHRALTPFADGEFGGYRQAEARRLIDALGPLRGSRSEDAP